MTSHKDKPVAEREISAREQRLINKAMRELSKINSQQGAEHFMHNALRMKHGWKRDIMMMLAIVIARTIKAKLGMPMQELAYLLRSQEMHDAQVANEGGWFTVPFAKLALWNTQNGNLDLAFRSGTEGDKQTAKTKLKKTLNQALAYVNGLMADDQENAEAIASSAKMPLVAVPVKNKQDFTIKQAIAAGSIILRSLAARNEAGKLVKANYEWQWSTDGVAWNDLPDTMKANTVAAGMEIGRKIWFRKRVTTTKGGTTPWCVPLFITVQ